MAMFDNRGLIRRTVEGVWGVLPAMALLAVAGSVVAFAWVWLLFGDAKLDGTGAAALLILVAVCVLFAFEGRHLIRQIRRIGPVEMQVWQDAVRIEDVPLPPGMGPRISPEGDTPWKKVDLTGQQKWAYELGSNLLFHLRHLGVNPGELPRREQARYRRLALWVARVALNEGHEYKALDVLRMVEDLPDLDYEERFYLAAAYWFVALREPTEPGGPDKPDGGASQRTTGLDRARRILERAVKQSTDDPAAQWALGYIYDELGMYDQAIIADEQAISIDSRFNKWSNWCIAVSRIKKQEFQGAIDALAKIPAGVWWNRIEADSELAGLRGHPTFSASFNFLCATRRAREEPACGAPLAAASACG